MKRRRKVDSLPIDNGDGTSSVPLGQGATAIIDSVDSDKVALFIWHKRNEVDGQTYAATNFKRSNGKRTIVRMHRFILCFPIMLVDHINHNGIDNRRQNLRLCDDKTNQANASKRKRGKYSKYKGVTMHVSTGLWKMQIMKHRKLVACTYHRSEIDAALAYDAAAIEHFGEFAATNASLGLLPSELLTT